MDGEGRSSRGGSWRAWICGLMLLPRREIISLIHPSRNPSKSKFVTRNHAIHPLPPPRSACAPPLAPGLSSRPGDFCYCHHLSLSCKS